MRYAIPILLGLLALAPAQAQSLLQDVKVAPARPYRHPHSTIAFPAAIDGLPRTAVRQIGTGELDVFATYERGGEMVSVYVYRLVAGTVPIWFDRARASIENRPDVYGTPRLALPVTAFTPPGQANAGGLMASWTVADRPYRGTALAVLAMNGWVVKLRYSSAELDGAALARRVPDTLAALRWPKRIAAEASVTEIAACPTALAFSGDATVIEDRKERMDAAILGSVLSGVRADATAGRKKDDRAPIAWCRDPAPVAGGAVYRADASTTGYMLAIGDAGRAVIIVPDTLGAMLREAAKEDDEPAPSRHSFQFVDMGSTSTFAPLDRLPPPGQALRLLSQSPVATTQTFGDKRTTNVFSAALE